MSRITMKTDGMMCGLCEAYVCDATRKAMPEAKKVTARHSRKEAGSMSEKAADSAALWAAIDAAGCSFPEIASVHCEEKGFCGRK